MPKRLYDAAISSDFHLSPTESGTADYVVNHAGYKLRDYARWLDENSDIAVGVLDTLVNNIIGTGVQIEPQVANRRGEPIQRINAQIRELWSEWTKRPEITGEVPWPEVQRLACRSWLRDGEIFSEHIDGPVRANRRRSLPYSIRLLESDWLPFETWNRQDNIVHGVEKDEDGMPVAYHFYKQQADPRWLTLASLRDLRRVPAERVEHVKFSRRLNQTRGVTILHSVIRRLDDIKDMEESERIAARVAAAWTAAIIRNPTMIDDVPSFNYDAESGADSSSRSNDRYFEMGPGTVWDSLLPGEDVKGIGLERPNNNLIEFLADQHRRIAAGTGASASSISKRYDGTYSAQRQELVESQPGYTRLRNYFICKFVQPIYERFLFWAVEAGQLNVSREVRPQTWMRADFRAPGMPWIDPQKEANANETAVKNGFKSRQMVIREMGYDPELVDQQIQGDMFHVEPNSGVQETEQEVEEEDTRWTSKRPNTAR